MKEDKNLYFSILERIKAGDNPSKICKDLNIKKQKINYYITTLKKSGCIIKLYYGVWKYIKDLGEKEVQLLTIGQGTNKNEFKQIRGHAFIWKVLFYAQNIDWERRLKKAKINYSLLSNGTVQRLIFKNRKIWLTKRGMIIYEPLDFLGLSSWETKGKAVFELDTLIKDFGRAIDLDLTPYKFTTSREHYGIIKNALAKQYNDKGEKIYIRGEDGGVWLWVDNSHSLEELENNSPSINKKVQDWYNDHKKHNFEVNSSFILGAIGAVTENQTVFAENMKTHVKAVQDLGKGVRELTEVVKELKRNV